MPEGVEALTLLLDRKDLERLPKNPPEVGLSKEVVVVVPVDDPVAGAPLTSIVLEAGAEGGQVKVPVGLEEWRESIEIPGPVGFLHMVEAPAVHQGVETFSLKGETKGVPEHKGQL
jgi:hypothetical protein